MKRPVASRTTVTVLVSLVIVVFLLLLPTGYEGALQFRDAVKCKVKILSVDNSRIIDTGLIRTGQQVCRIRFLSGPFKGRETEGWNMLGGSLAQDKLFHEGDSAQVLVNHQGGEIISVNLIDHYRLGGELALSLAFALFLLCFAGMTGLRAVLSFILTILVLWKVLVPSFLKGYDPIFSGFLVTTFLTIVIIALVYGFDRRLVAAAGGGVLGLGFAAVLSILCTRIFKIHGAVMPHSESLLYAGYENLNLTRIFMASVFVGASGSVMDLAVDITSAVHEVIRKCPSLSKKEAVCSGMHVAKAAMGTMTTTLLLAYTGSSIALFMTFMAQGTPLYNILNNNQVAAEIINTIAGSFGLATTAPFTALLAGIVLTGNSPKR
jgi:uncharacterized membrane protein